MITTQVVILMIGKIAVALSSIVAISSGMTYYHSFSFKKKGAGNTNTLQKRTPALRRGSVFGDED